MFAKWGKFIGNPGGNLKCGSVYPSCFLIIIYALVFPPCVSNVSIIASRITKTTPVFAALKACLEYQQLSLNVPL